MIVNVNYTDTVWVAHVPAISEATFPRAVVVVVATFRTPLSAFFNILLGLTDAVLTWEALSVSERPGISFELRYRATSDQTANFWSAIRSGCKEDILSMSCGNYR